MADVVDEIIDIADEAWENWQGPEPDDQPKPGPIPWSGPKSQPPETCNPDPDPDPRRLVEVGVGLALGLPGTTFEELYQKYQSYDEYVAVDPKYIEGFERDLRILAGIDPSRANMLNDPRVRFRKAKLSDLGSDYADFIVSISPNKSLANEIEFPYMDYVAKPGGFIYIVLDKHTQDMKPNLLDTLKLYGYIVIPHGSTDRMADPSKNILGIPIHSDWDQGAWWEIYKGSVP